MEVGLGAGSEGWMEPTGHVGSNPGVSHVAGSGRRYQVNAVHTSKACNVISKYTAFMPVDLSTNAYLPTVVEYTHTGTWGWWRGETLSWEGGCHLGNLAQSKPYEATAQFSTRPIHPRPWLSPTACLPLLVARTSSPWPGRSSAFRSGCPEMTRLVSLWVLLPSCVPVPL